MEVDTFIDIDEEAYKNCNLTDKEIIDIVTAWRYRGDVIFRGWVSSKEIIESVKKIKRFLEYSDSYNDETIDILTKITVAVKEAEFQI